MRDHPSFLNKISASQAVGAKQMHKVFISFVTLSLLLFGVSTNWAVAHRLPPPIKHICRPQLNSALALRPCLSSCLLLLLLQLDVAECYNDLTPALDVCR